MILLTINCHVGSHLACDEPGCQCRCHMPDTADDSPIDIAEYQRQRGVRKFEAHITCPRVTSAVVKTFAVQGWVFSAIDGDPVMGKRPYCYLTAYDTNGVNLRDSVESMASALRMCGVEVLREKVEEIIYDTKTGVDCVDACCGRCGEP